MTAEAVGAPNEQLAVVSAIRRACVQTGSDFHYLLGTAMRESSLRPSAQSNTSSASGLFQFVEQTWYGLVKDYGAKYGLGSFADAIHRNADGVFHVGNAADRHAILALRNNPQVSALMAGEYAQQSKCTLEEQLGRPVGDGELYAAHFLGAEGACRLIKMNGCEPSAAAADAFPQAAASNRSVFYCADGSPKTVREVYDWATRQVPVPAAAGSPKAEASIAAAQAHDADCTLASLWQPGGHSFFPSGDSNRPFQLTSGVLDLLASFSSVAKDRRNP